MPVPMFMKVLLLALMAGALGTAPAAAQPRLNTGNAEKGKVIAQRLCASCHGLSAAPGAAASSDILSFPAIARQEKATGEYLAGRIIIPHPAMPDIALDIAEIRDVIAYIVSLKPAKAP
jgi:cytochrome c